MIQILDERITPRPSHSKLDMDWLLVAEMNNNHYVVLLTYAPQQYMVGLYNDQLGKIDKPRYSCHERAARKIYYEEVAYWATKFEFRC